MLHGRMVRPPIPGASVVAVDESSIAGIPGARVLRKGDFIGVVAPREWDAIKALRDLKVTWSQVSDPFVDMDQLYDHIRKAPATKSDEQKSGDVEAAFAKAAKVVDADYEWPFQSMPAWVRPAPLPMSKPTAPPRSGRARRSRISRSWAWRAVSAFRRKRCVRSG